METIGWPSGVNQFISDETTIDTAEGGIVEDSNSNGYKDRRANSLALGNTYPVVMYFNWDGFSKTYPSDINGLTEYDRFDRWYKFVHKRGTKPFWFPSITKQNIDVLTQFNSDGRPLTTQMALYRITSAPKYSKSGLDMKATMTWEEVFSGSIEIQKDARVYDDDPFSVENHIAYIKYINPPMSTPALDKLSVKYRLNTKTDWSDEKIVRVVMKGNTLVMHLEDKNIPKGSYVYKWTFGEDSFETSVVIWS